MDLMHGMFPKSSPFVSQPVFGKGACSVWRTVLLVLHVQCSAAISPNPKSWSRVALQSARAERRLERTWDNATRWVASKTTNQPLKETTTNRLENNSELRSLFTTILLLWFNWKQLIVMPKQSIFNWYRDQYFQYLKYFWNFQHPFSLGRAIVVALFDLLAALYINHAPQSRSKP